MNWHFPFFILTTVTLYSVHSQFNSLSLEELGSNTGIQVFNQIIKSRPHENVVVSPHGIASILGMLQLGADGKTKKQLSTVMRYNVNGVCVCSPSSVRPCPQSCSQSQNTATTDHSRGLRGSVCRSLTDCEFRQAEFIQLFLQLSSGEAPTVENF